MARPFLKWAGGKRRLVRHLASFCPEKFGCYFEPFLGSGALFFHLAQTRPRFSALLSDSNAELINVYRCVRDCAGELVHLLQEHQDMYYARLEKYYYRVRDDCRPSGNVERAARTIFLNKTCYNGLFRVNRAGRFNVPHGTYVRPAICSRDVLFAASDILRRDGVEIVCSRYQDATARCGDGDFVYLDPPYLPLTKTASFTDYTSDSFAYGDHIALAQEFRRLDAAGCAVVLSNSNSSKIRELYSGFSIRAVGIDRPINCNAENRAGHRELIIANAGIKRAILTRRN
jgi:DNA adenine methylase